MKHGTRHCTGYRILNLRQQGLQRFISAVHSVQANQTSLKASQILLVDNIGIHRDKHVKLVVLDSFEQRSIGNTGLALSGNCGYHMLWKIPQESPRKAFVKNNPHAGTASNTSCLAASSIATTCPRFTVGKSYRKRSMESPSSRQSSRFCAGTRVPVKTGVPPRTSGDDVTMFAKPFISELSRK